MDPIDKRIIFSLIRNARLPQRRIAEEVGISAQALNYRMARLKESGVIKRYSLHVNPGFYGMISGFAAFRNDGYDDESIISKFKCLEEITIYEFSANEENELSEHINRAMKVLGPPIMKYIPEPREVKMRIGEIDRKILEELKKDPRVPVPDIAKILNASTSIVRKRLDLMGKNRVISVIAEVDLTKIDAVLFSVISRNVRTLLPSISEQPIFIISDRDNGILVCYSDNLKQARDSIEKMRKTDPDAEVMVVYEYEFKS